jgi:hypothetical protein
MQLDHVVLLEFYPGLIILFVMAAMAYKALYRYFILDLLQFGYCRSLEREEEEGINK